VSSNEGSDRLRPPTLNSETIGAIIPKQTVCMRAPNTDRKDLTHAYLRRSDALGCLADLRRHDLRTRAPGRLNRPRSSAILLGDQSVMIAVAASMALLVGLITAAAATD
jgi:hypothetical protein